jgi:hypothetical protein
MNLIVGSPLANTRYIRSAPFNEMRTRVLLFALPASGPHRPAPTGTVASPRSSSLLVDGLFKKTPRKRDGTRDIRDARNPGGRALSSGAFDS